MKLAGLSDAPQHMLPANHMYSASSRKRTFRKHQGAAFADFLQVADNRLGDASAGDIDEGH